MSPDSSLITRTMECVPNFSEGRDAGKVLEIARAAQEGGATLLDVHLDPDHNRSVLTLVGEPHRLVRAVFQAVRRAVELIDLSAHQGVHPRIGVADVVPFVPVSGVSREECVEAAGRLARMLADELRLPVYLYEWAAQQQQHRNLADVRALHAESIRIGQPLRPDLGPDRPHPTAGAVAVGARPPLVALNCYLSMPDISSARAIAARTRQRGGGPQGVKALGLWLEGVGRAQVSMNITDVQATPPHAAVAHVAALAAEHGIELAESELVGLLPLDSVLKAASAALRLPDLAASQVLELAIQSRMEHLELDTFLDSLASAEPTPGGGAASALAGSLAAALGAMVCNLTVGRPRYAAVEAELRTALEELEGLRKRLRGLMDKDEEAYGALMAQYKLPKETPEQQEGRSAAVESALRHAADVPLDTARTAVRVLRVLGPVARSANRNAISDAGAGALLAEAAARASLLNVRVNASLMKDREAAENYLSRMQEVESEAGEAARSVLSDVLARII
ncbi:MAG: glutamate formimidoyltransferase [Chloroflexota bacterium]|nr:glutamate formimidoyltransferase [Chloroflexota bacterium]